MNLLVTLKWPNQSLACIAAFVLTISACNQDASEPAAAMSTSPSSEQPRSGIRSARDAIPATRETIEAAKAELDEAAAAARSKWLGKTFEEFESQTFKEPIEHGKYIVNGDIALVDRKHLIEFFEVVQGERAPPNMRLNSEGALAVNINRGRPTLWNSRKKRQLTYCVSPSFGPNYSLVIESMKGAARAWEDAADVDFIHAPQQDARCTENNPHVLFDVRPIDIDGMYLARAFFPDDQRIARNILVDNSSFSLPQDENLQLVGILRHELGHVLGWRHEHTRPEAGSCFEDENYQPLTRYDQFSVMHYPACNGAGDWSLNLTTLDKLGSACIYGRGRNNPENLDVCDYKMPKTLAAEAVDESVFSNQSIAKGEFKHYGPLEIERGSIFTASLEPRGKRPGDPDLYVRYLGKPKLESWSCRPYLSNADETCEVEVPHRFSRVYVMVYGYASGRYNLRVRYKKPAAPVNAPRTTKTTQ